MSVFQEMEYPRRKNFIRNLNILLDSDPVLCPNKSLSARLTCSQPDKQKDRRKDFHQVINQKKADLSHPIKAKFQKKPNNFMSVSSAKNLQAEKRMIQTAQVSKRDKMKSMLSTENLHKQILNNRKVMTAQTYRRAKEQKAQLKNPQQDLRMVSSAQFNRASISDNRQHFASAQIKRNSEGILYDYRPRESPRERKQYLRKGSSINKSILNNIVRLKFSRVAENAQSIEEYIDNKEIISMIRLYKGKQMSNTLNQGSQEKGLKVERGKEKDPLYLQGWYNETEEFELEQKENPQE